MEDTTIERGIAHLDFPVEEAKQEPRQTHFADPIDLGRSWCGRPRTYPGFFKEGATHVQAITCAGCLQQFIDKGPDWWWDVHRVYFRSSCTATGHNCGH